jgi:hypothetical protein
MPLTSLLMTFSHSGVARTLRAAALRPAATPVRSFAPAVQRFASTTPTGQDGRIHQVIGAVVDGMSIATSTAPPPRALRAQGETAS